MTTNMELILHPHHFLGHVVIASIFIFGIWNLFNPGMALEKCDKYLESRLGWLYKPVVGCSICMASIWGFAYYTAVLGLDWGVLVFMPALSGVNYFAAQNLIK